MQMDVSNFSSSNDDLRTVAGACPTRSIAGSPNEQMLDNGVSNLFNRDLVIGNAEYGNYSMYDVIGREFFVGVTATL